MLIFMIFLLLAAQLQILELALNLPAGENLQDQKGLFSHLYLEYLSASTIGYGEIIPQTYLGQVSILATILLGFFFLALIVSLTSTNLEMSEEEDDAANEIQKIVEPNFKESQKSFTRMMKRAIEVRTSQVNVNKREVSKNLKKV